MKRNAFDLGHQSQMTGKIGRLQTLSVIPVMAGDSLQIDMKGLFRLSPLRRNITMDAKVDLFAFYIPHRHIYGENWTNFIKEGIDEGITFPGKTVGWPEEYAGNSDADGDVKPLWRHAGYNRIWNRYFRAPTDDLSILGDNDLITVGTGGETAATIAKYGRKVCYLKSIWTTSIDGETDINDRKVNISEIAGTDYFDILDLAKTKARYRTELQREWFARRYNDVMSEIWGSGVNIDADERPQLCMRKSFWLSGYDIDGTGDANLGQFSGKVAGTGGMHMPRKYFNEHGAVWLMCCIRFPTVHSKEKNFLHQLVNPSYKEIAGDYDIVAAEPPVNLETEDYFNSSQNVILGKIPYGQWYRHQAHRVHSDFEDIEGYAFIDELPLTKDQSRYVNSEYYDQVFQTDQLSHWNTSMNINAMVLRGVPTARGSIFAGAN